MTEQEMDFKTYQQNYVGFLKSLIKTRILGILSKEVFSDYPENLPKKYQSQMYQETLYLKDKQIPKPEKQSAYIKYTMQLHYLDMLNINFLHKLRQGNHEEFLKTNPQIAEILSEKYMKDLPKKDISYSEFTELNKTNPELVKKLQSEAVKKERIQKAWLFDRWQSYQEIIVIISLLESFLRESYDYYIQVFPEIRNYKKKSPDSDDICYSKLLKYFMYVELKLEQKFDSRNVRFLLDFWIRRCAIIHNNGVINERSLRYDRKTDLKLGQEVIIDNNILDKLYSTISNLQRIIYKKVRLYNEKNML